MIFNYSGRASRAEYWWFFLGTFLVNFAFQAVLLILLLFSSPSENTAAVLFFSTLGFIVYVALASMSVTVRRFHDHGKSGWWLVVSLIPLVGFIVLLVFLLKPSTGPNKYGEASYKVQPKPLGNLA